VLWSQFFAFFSILIENNEDPEFLGYMIETSNIMIKLADTYSMNNERDAFIFMFVQFGGLELLSNKELITKNLIFIKALMNLGFFYSKYLHSGWKYILNMAVMLVYYGTKGAGAGDVKNKS
jgi:hypothetical protein